MLEITLELQAASDFYHGATDVSFTLTQHDTARLQQAKDALDSGGFTAIELAGPEDVEFWDMWEDEKEPAEGNFDLVMLKVYAHGWCLVAHSGGVEHFTETQGWECEND